LELTNVRNKHVNRILAGAARMPSFQKFMLFSTKDPFVISMIVTACFKNVRAGLEKVSKYGYFFVNQLLVNMNNYLYLPKPKFMIVTMTQDLNIFRNIIFDLVKYLVFISDVYNANLLTLLKNNTSISTIILDERHINQEMIDIFIAKSVANPKTVYKIGVISMDQPFEFKINTNFSVYFNNRLMFNYKIV
jgi:hypothetical protein